ncbi:MAG: DUF202 domain-containing protein [Cytophagales bacterium]|nr:DUF202 domain-containing protein [Armatimonadota bacterium]
MPAPNKPEQEVDPRVLFAAERTLLAWIRTGLALMGFGFVVARFGLFLRETAAQQGALLPPPPTSSISLWLGVCLVVLGGAVNLVAARQHLQALDRLKRGESLFPPPLSPGVLLALSLAILGIVMTVYLFWSGR